MAVVELFRCTESGAVGETITFVASSTIQDLSYPEYGSVAIHISVEHQEQTLRYGCFIWAFEWRKRWLHHFVCAFCQDPAFRIPWLRPEWAERQPSVTTSVPLGGRTVELDVAIADAVVALNAAGAVTSASCQGKAEEWSAYPSREQHSDDAYIWLEEGRFPRVLVQTMNKAGFLAMDQQLRASAPLPDRAQANRNFIRLLNDWCHHRLDRSGQAYRVQPHPRSTLPVLPPILQNPHPDPEIQRLIEPGSQPSEDDLLMLAPREDRFARLSYATLLEQMPAAVKQKVEAKMNQESQAVHANVYRWYLRGLSLDLAIKKVSVQKRQTRKAKQSRHQRPPPKVYNR